MGELAGLTTTGLRFREKQATYGLAVV